MKKLNSFIFLFLLTGLLIGQNEKDALRYSMTDFSGTARFNSMGGAFGALGGDISSLSTNPGGIGVFRKSEFTITPGIFYQGSRSNYNGNSFVDEKYNFHFGNIGFIGSYDVASTDWENVNFGFGYNRIMNFDKRVFIQDPNTKSSLLDDYTTMLNSGNGTNPDEVSEDYPFSANLAYQTYLVNPKQGDSTQYNHLAQTAQSNSQQKTITTDGGMGETYLSFGGNYDNELYIGLTVGFPRIRYSQEASHTETVQEDDTLSDLQEYNRYDYLETEGSGFNFKFGMIYRITDWVRLGGAIHSPTFYSLTDRWNSTMTSSVKDGPFAGDYDFSSPQGEFDYSLTTPFKAIGSIGFVIAKQGLISAEYEFSDYSLARLRPERRYITGSNYAFYEENETIQNIYSVAHNIRAGAEWRFDPFSFRAGYKIMDNPFRDNINEDISRTSYTFGLGVRQHGYYLDFAYIIQDYSENLYMYETVPNPAEIKSQKHSLLVTLGFRY